MRFNKIAIVGSAVLISFRALGQPAAMDPIFAATNGANGTVRCAVIQPDGKVIVGGSFTTFGGYVRGSLARLNADGTVDPEFTNEAQPNGPIKALLLDEDGNVIIGGLFSYVSGFTQSGIARLTALGHRDDGFVPVLGGGFDVSDLNLDAYGRILVGGDFKSVNGVGRTNVARLWPDGTVDIGFQGPAILGIGNGWVTQARPQLDGGIVIGGSFWINTGYWPHYIARLSIKGELDSGFNTNNVAGGSITAFRIQPDGKTVFAVGGDIHRLTSGGQLDGAFDISFRGGIPYFLSLQSDGKILAGGSFTDVLSGSSWVPCKYLGRFNPDGSLDSTFAPVSGPDGPVQSINLIQDGRIVITGDFTNYDGQPRGHVAILQGGPLSAPVIDVQPQSQTLSAGQTLSLQVAARALPVPSYQWFFNNTPIQDSTNPILVLKNARARNAGGYTVTVSNSLGIAVSEVATVSVTPTLTSAGMPDVDFATGDGPNAPVNAIAAQADGKVVISGSFDHVDGIYRKRLARLNSDGSLDSTFDPGTSAGGLIPVPISAVALQGTNILIGGSFNSFAGVPRGGIARLFPDGSVDTTFNAGSNAFSVQSILLQGSNVVVGGFLFLARLSADGMLDSGYNPALPPGTDIFALAQQSDGRVIASLNRINLDGSRDNSFAPTLSITNQNTDCFPPPNGGAQVPAVRALCVQADDKIIIAGYFHKVSGVARNNIARLKADGTVDLTFNPGLGTDSSVETAVLCRDGKMLVGGCFRTYNGVARNGIARINSDGTLDVTFNPGAGVAGSGIPIINCLGLVRDGRVFVGGSFTRVNAMPLNNFARLYGDIVMFDPKSGGGTFAVSLATSSQASYILEFKEALAGSNWFSFPAVAGSGDVQTLIDTSPTNEQRFYRIRAE